MPPIIKGGIKVAKCFLGQLRAWENSRFGHISQCYQWTKIKFIGNVDKSSKGEGVGRETQMGGNSRRKGGKMVVGISRPLSPPPHSPLPPWPMVYLSYKCHLYSLKIMRDKAKLSSSHSQNCPKKQLATSIPPLIINRFLWTLWWLILLIRPSKILFDISNPMYVTRPA